MSIFNKIASSLVLISLMLISLSVPSFSQNNNTINLNYQLLDTIPDKLGVAGAFSGILKGDQTLLLIAGGANFNTPVWENTKNYNNKIYLADLSPEQSITKWINTNTTLPYALAYGSSVTLNEGIICLGGQDHERVYSKAFLIYLNENKNDINYIFLPDMPSPATQGGAAIIGDYIYYSCGQSGLNLRTATTRLWRLNISALASYINDHSGAYPYNWEILPPLPDKSRAVHITVSQHNGRNQALYIISGRRIKDNFPGDKNFEFLKDVWEFDPAKYDASQWSLDKDINQGSEHFTSPWTRKTDAPVCLMAAPATAYGQSHIFVLGGADGSLIYQADSLRDHHPGFPKTAWAYHTITDTWTNIGHIPSNQVTTNAIPLDDIIIIPSGEIRPRVRSNKIWLIDLPSGEISFGWLNYATLILYLLAMLLIGVYFTRRNKNTNDFFRGGQRIPWWAAACSIFATMLSSLTYMSVPAKAYMTNWEYLLGYPMIFLTAILVIYLILPFFRKIDATSAYEYLEKRFNRGARYLGSGFFIIYQIGRMAIVMYLSALALVAITPLTSAQSILIMGVLSIIYSTLGGVEAVIWTDTIQTFVLLGGAILVFIIVVLKLDGGFAEFLQVGSHNHKFTMINWDWDIFSYSTAAFWVIIIGSFGQNLVSYGSDQAIIQRYMTTSSKKRAAKSILTNGIISVPAGLLFFALGAALYVFYKSHPGNLDPGFQNDAILPLFIVQEIPAGLAGLIIAGVFAAAQSTISTSMNSTATAALTDFFRPWHARKTEKEYLSLARLLTLFFGLAGTGIAIYFASADIKSLLDQFFSILGLFGGALGGMFLLGMFTKKANGTGAVSGAIIGAITLFFISTYTDTHVYLYAVIGIITTMISGWLLSIISGGPKKDIDNLTIWDLNKTKN